MIEVYLVLTINANSVKVCICSTAAVDCSKTLLLILRHTVILHYSHCGITTDVNCYKTITKHYIL